MFTLPVDKEISFRLLMKKDARELFELVNRSRSHLRPWLPWVDQVKSPELYEVLLPQWLEEFARDESLQVGIVVKQQLVGVSGFHSFDHYNRQTSIGYWLAKEAQGKGIMTRVVQQLLFMAFHDYKMNQVDIKCDIQNHPSRRIPIRLGFVETALVTKPRNSIIYRLTKQQWEAIRK